MSCPSGPSRASDAAVALDAVLFKSTGWFCLDAGNKRVAGVRAGSMSAALALVGQGTVATVAGLLRSEFAVVDVDAAGRVGDEIQAALLSWCAQRDVWALPRASGGGPGHWHVFLRPGEHRSALQAAVTQLRATHALPARAVDLRRQVRPLSAPHRSGAPSPLPSGLPAAFRALQALSGASTASPGPTAAPPRPSAVYEPLARPLRPLPGEWQCYLDDGHVPASTNGWADPSSSTTERVATFWLVVCGHDEASAWTSIAQAHPEAFTKARARGRGWWRRHVWRDAGEAADSWRQQHHQDRQPSPAHVAAVPSAELLRALAAARAALCVEWLSWGRDERHGLRAVLEVLFARMERTGGLTVPCPERDLLLDTPLRARNTVRKYLHRLQELRFGQRLPTFTPGSTNPDQQSHTFALDERFTTADDERFTTADSDAVRLHAPPTSHTPTRPGLPGPGLWRLLGLPARHTYLAVLLQPGPRSPELAVLAGLVHGPEVDPTVSQLRTLDGHLQVLAGLGLVQVDGDGNWRAIESSVLESSVQRAAEQSQQSVVERVAQEREIYRQKMRPAERWQRQRAAALERAAKLAQARQKAWWDGLDPERRKQRRRERTEAFARLSLVEQTAVKTRLAEQRRLAGQDEERRRLDWIGAQADDAYAERVADRTVTFAAMPPPAQAAAVATWQAHRDRYGLTRRSPVIREQHAPVPTAAGEEPYGQLALL